MHVRTFLHCGPDNSCTSAHLCVYISPLSSKTSVNRIGCYLFTSNQLFFQEGIKLLFQWTKFGELFTPYLMVDDDVERFVFELTKNPWLYGYHIIRRLLFSMDKMTDIISMVAFPIGIYYSTCVAWLCTSGHLHRIAFDFLRLALQHFTV